MKKNWPMAIKLDRKSEKPIYQQLVAVLILEIQRGRLGAGTKLPGSRTLALELGINRNTVVEAYEELLAQGWIETSQGKSPRVVTDISILSGKSSIHLEKKIGQRKIQPDLLKLTDGYPDSRLFPVEVFSKNFGRIARKSGHKLYLTDLNPQGSIALRKSLSEMLRLKRALTCTEEDLIITRGSQQAIFLTAMALKKVSKEKIIAVESPGYTPAWEAFRQIGFEIQEFPIDEEGLDVDKLEEKLSLGMKITALYTTPHHQFPTTVTMKASRRTKLIELSHQYNFWIIEDDYDHDFHYESQPVFPLASHPNAQKVIYLCSLSKILVVGLRIGYLMAPLKLVPHILQAKALIDKIGDPILEKTIAEMIEEGEVQRHVNKMRNIYRERRNFLFERLLKFMPEIKKPLGGMALWVPLPSRIDFDTFSKKMQEHGLQTIDQEQFYSHHARIGFASMNESEMKTLIKALQSLSST